MPEINFEMVSDVVVSFYQAERKCCNLARVPLTVYQACLWPDASRQPWHCQGPGKHSMDAQVSLAAVARLLQE